MSYVAINDIASLFFQLFGSGKILAFFVVLFIVVLLFLLRVNIVTIFIVIIPLIMGLVFNIPSSNLIEVAAWVYWVLLIGFGLITAGVIGLIMRN